MDRELQPEHIFRRQEVDKLSDTVISRLLFSKEVDRLKKTKFQGPDDIFRGFLRNEEMSSVNPSRRFSRNP